MEVTQQSNLQDDQTSDYRSFGSNHLPCSQSRKISIGIMAEALAKTVSRAREEDGPVLSNTEKVAHSERSLMKENCKDSESIVSLKGKQSEAPRKDTSPWISARSLHQETPMTKTVEFYENQTSIRQSANGVQKKYNIVTETPRTKTVQFYANRTSILHSEDGAQKKFGSVTYGCTRKMGGSMKRMEEFAFAAAQEVHVLDKGAEAEKNAAQKSNEALRCKLWEILGTAPSQNERNLGSQTRELGANDLRPEGQFDQKGGNAAKLRQNSDTIETDSESPNQIIRRPVTRSLTRKKAPTAAGSTFNHKISSGGNLPPSPRNRRGQQEKNIFSFDEVEGWSRSVHGTINGSSSAFMHKRSERKSRVEPHKICFSGKGNPERSWQGSDRGKKSPPAMKTASDSNKNFYSHPSQNNREYLQPKNGVVEEELDTPAKKKKDQQEDLNNRKLLHGAESQEDFRSSSSKKNADPRYDVNSPTFGMVTPIKNCSPSPPPAKSKSIEQGVQSPSPADKRSMEEGFCGLRTSTTSKRDCFGLDTQTDFSDDTRELNESPIRESLPVMEVKGSEDRPSQSSSSSSDQDAESSEVDPPIKKGCRKTVTWTPETDSTEKPPFMLRPSKRLRSQEGIEINELSPTSPSQKGTEESNEILGPSDQNPEHGLARAVALFTLALERFKAKMKSQTSKKCSEILSFVAEGIQLQLQNIESHIQTDVGKFTSLGKSKRKRLETRFQEQQEQLKLIFENFKEEVSQHLQDCGTTLEELEVYQRELKGTADRQKALHRKLLLQVEEAIAIQLNDADRRIMAVHKVAREKMIQLKHVMAEFLKEGVFS